MRSSMARAIIMASLICPTVCEADAWEEILAKSRNSVTTKQPYALGASVTLTLERGQAAQLDVGDNLYGLEKYIIYYYDSGQEEVIRLDGYLTDGTVSGGGSKAKPTGQGGRSQGIAGVPYAANAEWRVEQGKATVDFRTTFDAGKPQPLPETERLAGFVTLWSEVKYNFAFFSNVPELDWDKVLVDYLPQVQAAETDVEYYRVLRRCMALLKDGHTEVWGPTDRQNGGRLPFMLERVEGMVVMTAVCDANAITDAPRREQLARANLRRGEAVTHIGGRTVEDILKDDIYPYICASTPQARDLRALPELVPGSFGKEATVRIKALDGRERDVTLACGRYRMTNAADPCDFRELRDGILYLRASDFSSSDIVQRVNAAMDRIVAARGLILDLRQNGGGSTSVGYSLLSCIIDKPQPGAKWKTRKYLPAHRAWGRPEQWETGDHGTVQPREGKRYLGPVVVLVGPSTCSAAEDFVTVFQCSGRGKVVGQRTNGSTGQPLQVKLPGGGGARICTKWDTYPDGREFVGIGCIPDVEVAPTRVDVAAGRDVVLERALAVLRESIPQ